MRRKKLGGWGLGAGQWSWLRRAELAPDPKQAGRCGSLVRCCGLAGFYCFLAFFKVESFGDFAEAGRISNLCRLIFASITSSFAGVI